MVFPDGVKWDAENRCYLTEKVNPVFASMCSISTSYKCDKNKKQDKSRDLSCLVAETIELSNEWLDGYKQIIDFGTWLKSSCRKIVSI